MEEPDKEKFKSIILLPSKDFRNRRNVFLKGCTNLVHKQHTDGKHCVDEISSVEKEAISEKKKCVNYGCEGGISYCCCRNCGGKLSRTSVENMFQPDIINFEPV